MSDQRSSSTAEPYSAISAETSEFVYRPISTLAVICLILSVLSLASFLNYYLIPLALIILLLSIFISVRLDRARVEYGGQVLAKLAVFLGLVATIGAGTSHYIRFVAVTRDARDYAEQFLSHLLADDLDTAFAMTLEPQMREACDNDVAEMIFRHNKQYEEFKANRVIRALRAGDSATEKAKITDPDMTDYNRLPNGLDLVAYLFRVQLANEAKKVYDVGLVIVGGVVPEGWKGRQWHIKFHDNIVEIDDPSPSTQ